MKLSTLQVKSNVTKFQLLISVKKSDDFLHKIYFKILFHYYVNFFSDTYHNYHFWAIESSYLLKDS